MKTIHSALAAAAALFIVPGAIAGTDLSLAKDVRLTPATPSIDDWKFSVGMPGWLAGLKGDIGVGGLTPVYVDVPFSKILQHLDMVAALSLEAQHGPWSFYLDGMYLKLSAGGNPPGPLLNSINVTQREVIAEAGVAYRLWEGKRGYFDLLAGARYLYMDARINFDVSSSGVQDVSRQLANDAIGRVTGAVTSAVTDALPELKTKVHDKIVSTATARAQERVGQILANYPRLPTAIEAIRGSSGPVSDAVRELIAAKLEEQQATLSDATAAIDAKVAAAKAKVKTKLSQAVQRAEQKLARQIEKAIKNAIPQEVSGSKSWVDPFVGFRARYNFTDNLYLAARADIGGFGISSKLAWQAYGALGYQFNNHWSSEFGYRYLSIDYEKGGFVYDAAMGGAFVGLKYAF